MVLPTGRACALVLAIGVTLLAALAGQSQRQKAGKDPYTEGDAEAIAKLGYVSLGPFPFGTGHTSTTIEELLGTEPLIWIETAHFRIGCALSPLKLRGQQDWSKEWIKKVQAELDVLRPKLPKGKLKKRVKMLDPWLRAHLTAYRMEKLYAETMELFGVTDESFPQDPSKVVIDPKKTYMGYGPYLGMRNKYLVFVVEKESTYRQYLKKYIGRDSKFPQRWHFVDASSLLFACPLESNDFPLTHDTALHCALAFNVSQNLLDGFRYYAYDIPVWIKEGFGHWNSRRIDGDWPSFDQNEGSVADMKKLTHWKAYAKGLLSNEKKWTPFPEVANWRDFGQIKFNDHVMVFSRIDYLLSQDPKKWQTFLMTVKGRVNEQWQADQSDLVGATREGLKQAYGLSFLNFDERWSEWVKETYPSK
ncbi:MAG: hypothetical protein KAI24_15870 [Planctomycetes bacterium]|nr:hypothetical protein [Planctomycetota bacterium]